MDDGNLKTYVAYDKRKERHIFKNDILCQVIGCVRVSTIHIFTYYFILVRSQNVDS